jgi:hypothetical protein
VLGCLQLSPRRSSSNNKRKDGGGVYAIWRSDEKKKEKERKERKEGRKGNIHQAWIASNKTVVDED